MTNRRPGETRDPNPGIETTLARAMAGEVNMGDFLVEFGRSPVILVSRALPSESFDPVVFAPHGEPLMAVFTARDRAVALAAQAPHTVVLLGRTVLEGLQPGVGLVMNPGSGLGFEMEPRGVASALGAIAADPTAKLPDPNFALEQAIVDARDGLITGERLLEVFRQGQVFVLNHSAEELAPFTFLKNGSPSLVGVFTRPEFAKDFTEGVEHSMFIAVDSLIAQMNSGFGIVVNPGSQQPWELGAEILDELRS